MLKLSSANAGLPAPPPLTADDALFLDLDGTLLELAATPDAVVVPPGLATLLGELQRQLGGAVAIVSGRRIAQIDDLLHPLPITCAGLHGSEIRWPGQRSIERTSTAAAHSIEQIAESLRQSLGKEPGIEVEYKQLAVALHFRNAPQLAAACEEAMLKLTRGRDDLRLLNGHSVIEALPKHSSKAHAISQLMQRAPFAGRKPCFVGDDITDEEAFPFVMKSRGFCVKVGAQRTQAAYRIDGPNQVLAWLRFSLKLLKSGNGEPSDS